MSKSQKKILIIAIIIALAFLSFGLFVYRPNKNKVRMIKTEIFNINRQIEEIEKMVEKDKSLQVAIGAMQARLRDLNNKFPQKEEAGLSELSDFAKKLNIEIISVTPQPKKNFLDKDNKELKIEERVAQIISVELQMRCFYKDLIKYIENLNNNLSVFISIERLKIIKSSSDVARLEVTLQLNLYLLS